MVSRLWQQIAISNFSIFNLDAIDEGGQRHAKQPNLQLVIIQRQIRLRPTGVGEWQIHGKPVNAATRQMSAPKMIPSVDTLPASDPDAQLISNLHDLPIYHGERQRHRPPLRPALGMHDVDRSPKLNQTEQI